MIQTDNISEQSTSIVAKTLEQPKNRHIAGWIFATCAMLFDMNPAEANTSEICDLAAKVASTKTGVPFSVLQALTRSETGRTRSGKLRPWPWTVNMEGDGKWFTTHDEALNYVHDKYQVGARSFDIGSHIPQVACCLAVKSPDLAG